MPEQLSFQLGLETIESYKRLSYTPWHALAEFVDNSTQSYFNNREVLDQAYEASGERLRVDVVYDRDNVGLRVTDNAMGMDRAELEYALRVGARPANTSGRSKYGMGLKTASCWLGNHWTVRTKKLGETTEYEVTVDVQAVAAGESVLPTTERPDQDPDAHHTVLEIHQLNRPLYGRTLGKIKEWLRSMYRQDLRDGLLDLYWQDERLTWDFSNSEFATDVEGTRYKRDFALDLDGGHHVKGWVGILDRGSRSRAGFSILHAGRVVKGWPDSWRPESIYGDYQGRNDLINQRVVGEVELDDFEVSHTKDDILWYADQQEQVEAALREEASEFMAVARDRRRGDEGDTGPTDVEIQTAVEEIQAELGSNELIDKLSIEEVPPPEVVEQSIQPVLEQVASATPDFSATLPGLTVRGYIESDMSPNDPYVVVDSASADALVLVVNLRHPHVQELRGAEGVANYLRHCVYDALAEWKARQRTSTPDPDTIKLLKDGYLRVSMQLEMH